MNLTSSKQDEKLSEQTKKALLDGQTEHLIQLCLELSIFTFRVSGLLLYTSFAGQSEGLILRYIVLFHLKACRRRRTHVLCSLLLFCSYAATQPEAASFYLFSMLCFIKSVRILIQVSFQYKSKPFFYEENYSL